jgi:uncharacterized delta-60 repeat protein
LYKYIMSAGTVDTKFNNPLGYVIKQFSDGQINSGNSVAIDRGGRIVVTGSTTYNTDNTYSMFITRYTTDGSLDTSFNVTGYVTKQFTAEQSAFGRSVAIDSDNRIVVTGYTYNTDTTYSMFITRYTTDGSLDTSFNVTGYVTKQYTIGQNTGGYSVAIDSGNRIVVTGDTNDANNTLSMFITRYKTDGTIDDTFNGTSGYVTKGFLDGQNTGGYSVAIASGDRIVVTGYTTDANNTDSMFITRYNTDGTIDDIFNPNLGYVTKQFLDGQNTIGYSVAIDSGNRIVVTGYTSTSGNIFSMFITRYNTDGTIDTTFNPNLGYVTKQFLDGQNTFGESVAIDSGNRIVVTGYTSTSGNVFSMFITRYNTDGTIDTSFNNSSGYVIVQYTNGHSTVGNSVAIDSGDRIVVTGDTFDDNDTISMFITRYLGTTTEPICLPAGTPILTDQGMVAIEKIDTKVHTINHRRIIEVTKTITPEKNLVCFEANSMGINCPTKRTTMTPGHEVLYHGKLVQAKHFVGRVEGVHTVPYNGKDVLYNVLQEKHGLMRVNNMVLETLHPENKVAKEILKKRYLQ